jgi:SAM-dependent methyltransferase
MEWEIFLADRTHHNLYVSALVYMPTIKIIRRIAEPGDLLLEAGCGSGRTAILLADMGYKVTAVDKSDLLLNRLTPVTPFLPELQLAGADIENLPFKNKSFTVAYSLGVLEHFDPAKIVKFLKEQRRAAVFVLVDVPNHKCTRQCFGDERFYSDAKWHAMFKQAGLEVKQTIHRGMDRGRYVGNCSVFLAVDTQHTQPVSNKIDVYDYY